MAKGVIHTVVILILVIVVFLVLLFAYYGKGTGMFAKLADEVLKLSSRFLPIEPRKELKPDEKLPQKIINTQQKFVDSIKASLVQSPEDKFCRVEFAPLQGMENFGMDLSNYNNNINFRVIKVKSAEGGLALNPLSVENAQICLINPEKFYECYIDNKRICPQNIQNFYKNIDIATIQNDKIKWETKDNQGQYQLAKFVLRIDSNKFCFVPLHSGFATKPGCDSDTDSLDNDCLISTIREIPICGAKLGLTTPTDKDKSAILEFDRFVSFLKDLTSKPSEQFCRKNFFFNTDNMGEGYYIYINPNGQIDLRFNKDAGKIIKREKIAYIPYGTLLSEESVKTHFNEHDTFRDTFIISPSGDYSTSDKSTYIFEVRLITAVSNNNKGFLTEQNPYINRLPTCK
ncbi:MAG: hypothetical protein AABX33_07900 [Nanoarchaeota archaeon]